VDYQHGSASANQYRQPIKGPEYKIPMLMFPLRHCPKNPTCTHVPYLPSRPWITALAFNLLGSEKEEEQALLLEKFIPGLCKSLAGMNKLKALWIVPMVGTRISRRQVAIEHPGGWAWAAQKISEACPSLHYVKIGVEAWRIWRKFPDENTASLEVLSEWEDEVEGPEFFHSPAPLPWSKWTKHTDWKYPGY
jgi:hypothetical protein